MERPNPENEDINTHLEANAELKLQHSSLLEERVTLLYQSIPLSIVATLVLEALLSVAQWSVINKGDIILWNLLVLVVVSIRLMTWFYRNNSHSEIATKIWLNAFRVGACLAGTAWGSAAYFMFAQFNPPYQALLAFTIAGVVAGAQTTLAIDKPSVIMFVILAVTPLCLRLHFDDGPIAVPMSIMSAIFIAFVISASNRTRAQQEENFAQNQKLIAWSNERLAHQEINHVVSQAQALMISDQNHSYAFETLLADTVQLTQSQFGFIAEVCVSEEGAPYLDMRALTDISWDQHSKSIYEKFKTEGMKQTNLNTLFGAALTSGNPIISNNPALDMRAGGTAKGHPSLSAFLGIPIYKGDKKIAMLGLANKNGGYLESDIAYLKPILDLITQFTTSLQHYRQHLKDQENLQHQATHTQTILDVAFDAIITMDNLGIITSFNHAAEIMFGYRKANILGANIASIIPSLKTGHADNTIEELKYIQSIIGVPQEFKGLRKNGKTFDTEVSISEFYEQGKPTFIGTIRDISERKKIDTIKNDFISTVSHELRTPLTSISASLAIIESGKAGQLPEKIFGLVQIAKQNSLRLQNLINELLDMDRLLANKLELTLKRIDALALVEKAIEANQYIAQKHHIKFNIYSAENNCWLYADDVRMQQVLGHLLSNAAKFSNPQAVVDIAINRHKHFIKISVTDYGSGIPPEFHKNIFKIFSQADGSSTRQREGCGLGLAISKELIEKMGGTIGFTSNIGHGSCFYIELPVAKINT